MKSACPGAGRRSLPYIYPILGALTALFFPSFAVPVAGAVIAAGSGSYTTTLPAGKTGPSAKPLHKTSNVTAPIPTSDWWTSLISTNVVSATHTGSRRMFAFPLSYRCDINGLIMGLPQPIYPTSPPYDPNFVNNLIYYGDEEKSPYRQQLLVKGFDGVSEISGPDVQCDGYGDWTVTAKWRSSTDESKFFKATFGHGLVFTYFSFSENVDPRIAFPFDWGLGSMTVYDPDSNVVGAGGYTGDHVSVRVAVSGSINWYGIYASTDTHFDKSATHILDIDLPAGKRYLSIVPLTAQSDLQFFYEHAYAFITDTHVNWSVNEAAGTVTTQFTADIQKMRTDAVSENPVIALFPHQWKNAPGLSYLAQTFSTLRGTMKLIDDNSFTVTLPFHGIIPCLPARGTYSEAHLKTLLSIDKDLPFAYSDTYFHGKELSRTANLIPLAVQADDTAVLGSIKNVLKSDLENWLTYTPGESDRFFYYNAEWGGMIGYDTDPDFRLYNFGDQHFHYGYFVYASALLGFHYPDFVTRYGPMVDLLIRSYASPDRNDAMFPFLRMFDPYEGHSWADGFAADSEDGNNQESSSEAMNSWSAIYLWGLASGNDTYRDLGIWGYVTEASAIREYYFNQDYGSPSLSIYSNEYQHNVVGILFGGKVVSEVWWDSLPISQPEWLHGIQYIPLNPSMFYLGYEPAYAQYDYNKMVAENGGEPDNGAPDYLPLIWRYQSFYDPALALSKYNGSAVHDQSSSRSFLYHWLHVFNQVGTVDTSVRADATSYAVFKKDSVRTYVCFNPSSSSRAVRFYDNSDTFLGAMTVGPYTMRSTNDFTHFTVQQFRASEESGGVGLDAVITYPNPYMPGSGGKYDRADGMVIDHLTPGARVKIYTVAGELVWSDADDDGDGIVEWHAINDAGRKVASGVYVYYVSDSSGRKKTGKFAVIR